MARYQIAVRCVDFNAADEVNSLLLYLKNNRARVTAFDQKKLGSNTFAILTRYREKESKK